MVAEPNRPALSKRAAIFSGLLAAVTILGASPLGGQPFGGASNPFKAWVGSPIKDLQATLIEIRFAGKSKKLWPSVGVTGGTNPSAAQDALETALGQNMQPSGVAQRFVLTPDQLRKVLAAVATFNGAPASQSAVGIYGIQMTTRQTAALLLGASGKQDLATLTAAMPTAKSRLAVSELSKQIFP
jgi:hypothetical protein